MAEPFTGTNIAALKILVQKFPAQVKTKFAIKSDVHFFPFKCYKNNIFYLSLYASLLRKYLFYAAKIIHLLKCKLFLLFIAPSV